MDINKTQTRSFWIPNTPVKQGLVNPQHFSQSLANPQPICGEKQEFQPSLANWLNLNLPPQPTQEDTRHHFVSGDSVCFQGEIQARNEGDPCNRNDIIQERSDDREIALVNHEFDCRDKAHIYYDFCNEGLMQLSNAAPSENQVRGVGHIGSSSFASGPNHLVELAPFQAESSVCSLAKEKPRLSELEHQGGNILGTNDYLCGQSFPVSLSHQTINGTVLSAGLSLYHPAHVASIPTNTVGKEKDSHEPYFGASETPRESDECEAHNNTIEDSSKLQRNNQSELVDHESCATVSNAVLENHEPDMGGDHGIDPKTPRQKPKRKKHRPKVIFDRQSKSIPKTTHPARSEKSVSAKRKDAKKIIVSQPRNSAAKCSTGRDPEAGDTPKRKYTKRKGVDQVTKTTPEKDVTGTTSSKTIEPTRRSCRRSLNFGVDFQVPGEIYSCQPFSALSAKADWQISNVKDQMALKVNLGENVDVMMERTEAGQTCHLQTREDKLEGYSLIKGIKSPGPPTPVKFDQLNSKSISSIATGQLKGKCQIIFSDATHDKEPSIMKTMTTNTQCTMRTLNKSNCGSIFSQDKPARRTKRRPLSCIDASESYSIIAVDFPAICKKKRRRRLPKNHAFTSLSGFEMTLVHCNAGSGQSNTSIDNIQLNLKQARKKRSKYLTWPRDLASLHRCLPVTNPSTSTLAKQELTTAEGPQTCREALVAVMPPILSKKPRSKRHLLGFPAAMNLKSLPSIDAIIEQFSHLDIAAESNAIIAYHYKHPRSNDLVYRSGWNMVPFDFSYGHIRKRRARPKVDLDDETTRVWKLLLEDINKEGIDGTDEDKRKWWQEERKVFHGRVNSFVAKMRLVQGDRRFSPWKGSVVDSVIGVFLTQNVSDHLSSSAFMSMAARFPLNPSNSQESCCKGLFEKACLLQLGNTADEEYAAVQYVKNIDRNRNSHAFFRNPCEDIKSTGNLECPSSGSSGCGPSMLTEINFGQSDTLNGKHVIQLDEDQKSLDEVLSSQNSISSPFLDLGGQIGRHSSLGEESNSKFYLDTSFLDLLKMQEHVVVGSNWENKSLGNNEKAKHAITCPSSSCVNVNSVDADPWNFEQLLNSSLSSSFREDEHFLAEESRLSEESAAGLAFQNTLDLQRSFTYSEGTSDTSGRTSMHETLNPEAGAVNNLVERANEVDPRITKPKRGRNGKEKQSEVDGDSLRRKAHAKGKRDRTASTMDSVDWEAVRCAEVEEIAQTIKERGMNNMLAERIKDFLNRLVREHSSIDLEWLRDVPPDDAKEYLLSIRGLGLKSVECVRLLTLHHVAFPVDTNVGRIAVRLGWVPLQPLPESLQLHLLEMYPVLESIQKYLWPRLCRLDQRKLYELHYQMITFGKVFCTKSKPNCNACPMRGECRHFASAYASSRLALPAPEERSIVTATELRQDYTSQPENIRNLQLPEPERTQQKGAPSLLTLLQPRIEGPATPKPIILEPQTPEPEPIIEEPETPELEQPAFEEPELTRFPIDIEDIFLENDDELPTLDINLEALNQNVQNFIQNNVALQVSKKSTALVVVDPEAASIPQPKLKNISRLRTEHQVYVLPDSHELLNGLDKREQNDPSPYLLAIWAPGETINSIQPPERRCSIRESGQLCHEDTCFSCNSMREATSQTVRGTLLIPCRTAMRGSFPLNGTYFQVNEVFADHETSLNPINVPRDWLWNLLRRTVYFGTSIPSIFKGLGSEEIRYCFWRGFVCVRGFDRASRAPRPLIARLHFPASKMPRNKGGAAESKWPRFMSDE